MKPGAGLAVGTVAIITAVVVLAVQLPEDALVSPAAAPSTTVVISEVVTSNGSVLADEDGDYSDWIELHNHGDEPADLAGHHLSDDPEDLQRWSFPAVTIGPGARLIVFASGKDRRDPEAELHTDFSMAQEGEPLVFSAPGGRTVLDEIDPVTVPRDASYGRHPDQPGRHCFFERPAPGEPNTGTCHLAAPTDQPQLSVPGGFHDEAFDLTLHTPTELDIYYTLDGSYPDPVDNTEATSVYESPLRVVDRSSQPNVLAGIRTTVANPPLSPLIAEWEGPDAPVQKATVVRARTPFSEETTATYFVGAHLVRDDLPVVSIATDRDHLFDDTTGIYVPGELYQDWLSSASFDPDARWFEIPANFNASGRAWERPAEHDTGRAGVFTFCEPDDGCVYTNGVGLRVHGGISRSFPIKSFRLYARNAYGDRSFEHPFFGEEGLGSHRRLLLRASGNDWNQTMLLDGYAQSLVSHLDVETQDYQPTVTFVNGEYWGVMNLRERFDQHYLSVRHDLDPADVVVVSRSSGNWELPSGEPGDEEPYLELLEFVAAHDLADPEAFAHVEERMDLDDLLDYLLVEIFTGNGDWPGNNTEAWRVDVDPDPSVDGVDDGRWRWLVFDLDQLGGNRIDPQDDTLDRVTSIPDTEPINTFGVPLLVTNLLDNAEFRTRFVSHAADHLNTTFDPDRTVEELDELEALLEGEMERHTQRWPGPVSMDHWRDNVDLLRTFMRERPAVYRQQLVERFGLDGTTAVRVRTSGGGRVSINDVALDRSTPGVADPADWEGTYFQGVPLRLHAEAADGHRFVGWERREGATTTDSIEITPDGPAPIELEAVFEPA